MTPCLRCFPRLVVEKRACEGAELGAGGGCHISVLGLLAFRNYQDT